MQKDNIICGDCGRNIVKGEKHYIVGINIFDKVSNSVKTITTPNSPKYCGDCSAELIAKAKASN